MPAGEDPGRRPLPPDLARLLHDVRGPLNSLTFELEFVLKHAAVGNALAEERLRAAQAQLGRLTELLAAAFAVAALERGPLVGVDLRVVVEAARGQAGAAVDVGDGPWPTVAGDAALLTLAISHLVLNAVEATPAGGRAPLVSVGVAGNTARLQVRDWGHGLRTSDPKLLIKLLHSTKPGHRGIGLVTVERVARLHAGDLRLESPGDGTAVTLTLPLAP
ncbi:MAG TPA: HAMP domain-containing sensor histidine kinase [Methylomirabilota bacterium]|nr:HAMP domain-containing sensor histidine kinase [Methylomirabilota bacterium]